MVGRCQSADNSNKCVCCITQRKIAQVIKTFTVEQCCNDVITVIRACCNSTKYALILQQSGSLMLTWFICLFSLFKEVRNEMNPDATRLHFKFSLWRAVKVGSRSLLLCSSKTPLSLLLYPCTVFQSLFYTRKQDHIAEKR